MLTIRGLSDKPCFICGATTDIADTKFKDGVTVPLCAEHVWKKLKEAKRQKKREQKVEETPA